MLRVLDLTDEPLSVVPLFETIDDLAAAPTDPRELLADERYAARSPNAAAGSR